MRVFAFLALCASLVVLAGCPADHDDHEGAKGCAADARKDIYTQGLSKSAGSYSVRLMEATPAPPVKGNNVMTIEVVDASNMPVDGATIAVTPWMPDHAHGSAVRPEVVPAGGGRYTVNKIYLPMPGLWEIKISVARVGATPQEAAFNFCVDG